MTNFEGGPTIIDGRYDLAINPVRLQPITDMHGIATVTINPTVDMSTSVARVLPEEKLRCARPYREPGGGGVNVARAVKRLGGNIAALLTAGGSTGDSLLRLLDDENIEHRAIPIRDWTRENVIIDESSTGRQFRFGMPGPDLSESEWQKCLVELAAMKPAPDFIVASGSLPPSVPNDFYARVGEVATNLGARLILDASGEGLRRGVQPGAGIYLVKPNLRELRQLAGKSLDSERDQEEFARTLIESQACEVVVLSLGAAGAFLVTADDSELVPSPSVPIRSKVGAGDSMVAGIVLALARGWKLDKAVRFGVAAGAAAVMTPGTELCRRSDTERLYEGLERDTAAQR